MSDFTIDETMAELRYEIDEREIFNDIRSEIQSVSSETIVDSTDVDYSWRWRTLQQDIPGDGIRYAFYRTASHPNPVEWKLDPGWTTAFFISAGGRSPYYGYDLEFDVAGDKKSVTIYITNNGAFPMHIHVRYGYRFKTTTRITHEEQVVIVARVRATDATSIAKYGRRDQNLVWSEGTSEGAMQAIVDHKLARYKEPTARLRAKVKGVTDTLRTQIITREISDIITVISAELGLNADCFIESITIQEDGHGIPVCIWILEVQRTYETLTLFTIGTSLVGGAHVIGY